MHYSLRRSRGCPHDGRQGISYRIEGAAGTTRNVLLSGIVGSTAYGIDRAGSDVDHLGVFAVPTEDLHGLHPPSQSYATAGPDSALHEAAKWCRLALGGNPTVPELVLLPDDLY